MNYSANIDTLEVEKFSSLAARWWDPNGPCAPLHALNPCRLHFIQQHAQLASKAVLDIGCGAGILSESLAHAGAIVVGIDASAEVILAAQEHAQISKLAIEYHCSSIESFMLNNSSKFDIITCMELLEHVPDPAKIIRDSCSLLKAGGQLFLSTLDRSIKAYALAIIGAEYLLNILPPQTHDYNKFIRPAELAAVLRNNCLDLQDLTGIDYKPFTRSASLCKDVNVNYLAYAIKD